MQLKFIGTGGAFEPEYFNSAALLSFKNKTILIDAGFTVYPRLLALDLFFKIDYILITHLHNDHSGSLANILLHKYFHDKGQQFTILYQSEKFKKQLEEFLVIQLKDTTKYANFAPLETLSDISALDTFGRHSEGFQTYSFIFEEENERLVYSGDLGQADFLFAHLQKLPPLPTTVFHDITFNPKNEGHAHYTKLQPYQAQYKIFGYHCNPTENPADNTIPLVANQPELFYPR
ncbi:MBL fold metallo-hydrolase [Adhaeribacter rhizoryzae]|uniref:MBL fold metallo-hydrolase n=1 Tax=Adhaeribacter rhizoryzae TaxID=2607907 RepID=A0A5M6CYT8_9BACT|nr:MBL fold metallo-hydrolase [Adhaeribacter rhizoryzae]KAA5540384.1 MBL fold metallo-hydrolase [Adhaeribacter rhizoryzae]